MPLVDKRYAEALINVSVGKNAIELYQNELAAVSELFRNESGLRVFLLNPKNSVDTKKTVIAAIFKGRIQQELMNMLFLLLDKSRISRLGGIYQEFSRMADEKRSILNVTIMTAIPIGQEQIDSISEKFRKLYNSSSVKTAVEIDPTLVGGVKVAIGDKLYDGSVKGKLSRLQSILAGQ
jgi:F-type H+-transporting ATPase subunit delta